MIIVRASLALVVALGAFACDPEDDAADAAPRSWEDNGFRLNGFRLNGFRLNGFRLNGGALDGDGSDAITLTKFTVAGGETVGLRWVHEGELMAWSWTKGLLSGTDLLGARLRFEIEEDGAPRTSRLRIVGITPPGPESPVWLYDLVVKEKGEPGPWEPLCVDASGEPTPASLLEGVWDPETGDRVEPTPPGAITLACLHGALAKCVQWGYLPWEEVDGVALADTHQACTRAARADYCGDGTAHTHDGVLIHVTDPLGIEAPAPADQYVIEAEWGPEGATCLNPENAREVGHSIDCALPICGEPYASGGLVQTGLPLGG